MSRPRRRAVTALLVATATLAAPPVLPATAAAPSKDERIDELRDAIGEASREEAAALAELADIRARRADLDAAVARLGAEVDTAHADVVARQAEVDRLTAAALELDAKATETGLELGRAEREASAASAALYVSGSGVPLPSEVLGSDELRDLYAGRVYLSTLSDVRREAVVALADLRDLIEDYEREAQARRDAAETARGEAERRRAQLAQLQDEQRRQRDAARYEESREADLVASIRARVDEFTAELATLQASSSAITDMLRNRQSGQVRADPFRIAQRPVPGPVVSRFGLRVHPILGNTRMHNGADMDGDQGDAIVAAASGTVAFAGVRNGYGTTVIVDHGNQFATLYAHASSLLVSAGDRVDAGETIARVGATGLATGPHLHFEVRLLGAPVDPAPYL